MNLEHERLFARLQRNLEFLRAHPCRDNEAMRHDQMIRPLLVDSAGLGWQEGDIHVQQTVNSFIDYDRSLPPPPPRRLRPDIVIQPLELPPAVAVLEEKRQLRPGPLVRPFRRQLSKYQKALGAIWAILTDGETWLLWREQSLLLEFWSLKELKLGLRELQSLIGRDAVLDRYRRLGTLDCVTVAFHTQGILLRPRQVVLGPLETEDRLFLPVDLQQIDLIAIGGLTPHILSVTPVSPFSPDSPLGRLLSSL